MLLLQALEKNGMKESDIKLVDMPADDSGASFMAGKLDAAVTWEPWVSKAVTGGNGSVLFSSASIPNVILDSIAVLKPTLDKDRAELSAFVKAIDRGVQFLRENPDEAAAIIGKALGVSADEAKGMLKGDNIYSLGDNRKLTGSPEKPGTVYTSMKTVRDFLLQKQLITKPVDPATLIEPSLIKQ